MPAYRVLGVKSSPTMTVPDAGGVRWVDLGQLEATLNELGQEGFSVIATERHGSGDLVVVLSK